jgi:CYTH domain-containing protein
MSNELEIERRWILRKLPELRWHQEPVTREVGYIFNDHGELRVVRKHKRKGKSYQLTVKDDGGLVRNEWQEKIPEWAFKVLWPKTEGRRLTVARYIFYDGDHKLEFDVYQGRFSGLVKLECEFKNRTEALRYEVDSCIDVVCEVTEDIKFNNKNLSALDSFDAFSLVRKVLTT